MHQGEPGFNGGTGVGKEHWHYIVTANAQAGKAGCAKPVSVTELLVGVPAFTKTQEIGLWLLSSALCEQSNRECLCHWLASFELDPLSSFTIAVGK
jgi:hypothetical protein